MDTHMLSVFEVNSLLSGRKGRKQHRLVYKEEDYLHVITFTNIICVCLVYAHSHVTMAKSCWPIYLSVKKRWCSIPIKEHRKPNCLIECCFLLRTLFLIESTALFWWQDHSISSAARCQQACNTSLPSAKHHTEMLKYRFLHSGNTETGCRKSLSRSEVRSGAL